MADKRAPSGSLYVVATPIGNLDDLTPRALKTLQRVDLIVAEDTRHTRRLLEAQGIQKKLISCHEHNEGRRAEALVARLLQGAHIALVTDAGTPTISDPGYRLVRAAAAKGLPVVPIPGVSAAIAALSASGLATDSFTFIGFPARSKAKRMRQLETLAVSSHTLIFFQAPHRLVAFVHELIAAMGDRPAVLARELTKMHEEFIRSPLSQMAARLEQREKIRGECTLIVSGASVIQPTETDLHTALTKELEAADRSLSQVARALAREFNLPRSEVYSKALKLRDLHHKKHER